MPNGTGRTGSAGQRDRGPGLSRDRDRRSASTSGRHKAAITGAGNAKRNYDRYIAFARAATLAGDAVESENYYQHAEHYLRLMRAQTA